jgi:hypothetical protein
MASFPTTIMAPSFDFDEETYKPQTRIEFDANYVQSRPRSTRAVDKFNLNWNQMPEDQYQVLKAFFIANQGTLFDWIHPITGVTYSVRFSSDSMKSRITETYNRQVSIALEQA